MITALTIGWQVNPTLHKEGSHYYIIIPDGGKHPKKQYLGKALEGWRFAPGCDCGHGHCFYETLHNFTKRQERLCRFCSLPTGLWDAAGKDPIPECERAFMQELQAAGLDKEVACQADLPYWHGRVDFYHMPSRTAIQIDGKSHFIQAHHRTAQHQLQMDIKCCRAAWMGGGRLLRLPGDNGVKGTIAAAAIELSHSRFVMVSREYKHITVAWKGISKSYADWLLSALPGAKQCIHTPTNCIVFV